MVVFLQDESYVDISQPSICTLCEEDDSLLKSKVQTQDFYSYFDLKNMTLMWLSEHDDMLAFTLKHCYMKAHPDAFLVVTSVF